MSDQYNIRAINYPLKNGEDTNAVALRHPH